MVVDPDFEKKTLQDERKIVGKVSVTPIYDLLVTVIPTYNHYCLPIWDKQGHQIAPIELPDSLPYSADIMLGDADTGTSILHTDTFTRGAEISDGVWQYEWHIKGWNNGIVSGDKLDKLIAAIVAGSPAVNIVVHAQDENGDLLDYTAGTAMSLCAPIWGSGQNKIVGMYAGGQDVSQFTGYFDGIRKNGFAAIEPYASNQQYFSYSVDLKRVFDQSVRPMDSIEQAVKKSGLQFPTLQIQNSVLIKYFAGSSCPNGIYLLTGSGGLLNSNSGSFGSVKSGIALVGAPLRGALIDSLLAQGLSEIDGSNGNNAVTYLHEFSHTFANLNDEYVYPGFAGADQNIKLPAIPLTNCSENPSSDFVYGGMTYGASIYKGCSFMYDPNTGGYFYRPSNQSIMNSKKAGGQFNIVSCGYIMAAILGGKAQSYWWKCAKMSGVIRDGYRGVADSSSSNQNQVAAAAVTGISQNTDSPYMIAESFDPNDQWGGTVRLLQDGEIPPANSYPVDSVLGLSPTILPSPQPIIKTTSLPKFLSDFISGTQYVFTNVVTAISSLIQKPATPTFSPTPASTFVPTQTSVSTISPSPTNSIKPTPTITNTTPAVTRTPSPSYSPTSTISSTPTYSYSPTPTPTYSATPTYSYSPTPKVTNTPTPIPSQTPVSTYSPAPTTSSTPAPTTSSTPTPTNTASPTPTATPTTTSTPTPSKTPSPSPSPSPKSSPNAFNTSTSQSVLGLMASTLFNPWLNLANVLAGQNFIK